MFSFKKSSLSTMIIGFFTSVMKLNSFFKVSLIIGSSKAFFSLTNCVSPLSGAFGGIRGSFLVTSIAALMRVMICGFNPFILLAYHLPSFFASLYLASGHWTIRLLLPLICMFLFVIHPVGSLAWGYSLFWLLPIGIYLIKRRFFFIEALGSTFVAHAVGSVVWLYAIAMTPAAWYSLIPLVIVERLVFASGMTLIFKGVSFVEKKLQQSDKRPTDLVSERI